MNGDWLALAAIAAPVIVHLADRHYADRAAARKAKAAAAKEGS